MPSLSDMVMGMIGQRIGPYEDRLAQLRQWNPAQARTQVDMARGALEGRVAPMFQDMDPSELALYDRLAWGREMKDQYGTVPALLSSMLMGGGYEAAKALEQGWAGPHMAAIGRAATGGVGRALGGANTQHMQTDETTSPASLRNVLALMYGALR